MKPLCDRIALIQKGYFKDWYAYKYHFKLWQTIYNVRTRNAPLIQDLKEYPSQYSVYAFGEYIHYIDKM
jgi:hypothetical protein